MLRKGKEPFIYEGKVYGFRDIEVDNQKGTFQGWAFCHHGEKVEFKKDSIDYKVDVMRRFQNGEKVEYKEDWESDRAYESDNSPDWDWENLCYRIEPKVKELTINEIEEKFGCKVKVVDNA